MRKNVRTLIYTTLAAVALGTTAMVPIAANAATVAAGTVGETPAKADLTLSQDGFNVMRSIREARVAIFGGHITAARGYLDDAKIDLGKVKYDATALMGKGVDKGAGNWIPINGQLIVSDDLVTTADKVADHTGGKLAATKKALPVDEASVGYSRTLMPLAETTAKVNEAIRLMDLGNYYDANLALRAAEAGLRTDTTMMVGTPPSDQSTSVQASTVAPSASASQGMTAGQEGQTASAQTSTQSSTMSAHEDAQGHQPMPATWADDFHYGQPAAHDNDHDFDNHHRHG